MRSPAFIYLVLLYSFVYTTSAFANTEVVYPPPQAKSINVVDTEVLRKVNTVFQTSQGIIWLGTDDGAIRFDGYKATRYVSDNNDPYSISHPVVTAFSEDDNHNIYIATLGGGLNRFNPQNHRFERISLRVGKMDYNLSDDLFNLVNDNQGNLWLGSERGLKRFSLKDNEAQALPPSLQGITPANIAATMLDGDKLWVACRTKGMFLLHNQTLKRFPFSQAIETQINQIIKTPSNDIWLATNNGLFKLNQQTQSFDAISQVNQSINAPIKSIAIDHNNTLWLGTIGNGIYRYDIESKKLTALRGELDIYNQYSRKNIYAIFKDQQQSLWIASEQGLLLVTKQAMNFDYITNNKGDLTVSDIAVINEEKIAFAGLHQYYEHNVKTATTTAHLIDENRIYRINRDSKDNLWFATLGQGVQHYQTSEQKLIQIDHITPSQSNNPMTGIFDAFVDNHDHIWLLPFPDLPNLAGGIYRLPIKAEYQSYLESTFVKDLIELEDNHLLAAADGLGIISIYPQNQTSKNWSGTVANTPKRTLKLFKDSKGVLWVGTMGQGLARYNAEQQKFNYIDVKKGLISNNIYSIIEDQQQQLWLASDKGLTLFNPITNAIVNIDNNDGLLMHKFYKRAGLFGPDGRLWLGSDKGVVSFDPQDFKQPSKPLKVLINDFKLFNQSVQWQTDDPRNPLKQPIEQTKELILDHHNYMFSFNFSTTEYIRPDKIRFAYKMEGLDDNWVYTTAENRIASYTTLSPNDYIFKVKVANRDGIWSKEAAEIKVSVLPPWWQSWQAYIGYIIILLAIAYLTSTMRTRKLLQRAVALEENVAQRTKELQDSRDQVTQLLTQKQQLFASVSHEFRTPLTLILTPVEHLLTQERSETVKKELQLIKRNSRRLLRMVDQLLEFAKLELNDNRDKEIVTLAQSLELIVSSFELLVKTKNISLSCSSFDDVSLKLLPDSLNKILINILSNAFKYSKEHSSIHIQVTNLTRKVQIAISDTGVGIAPDDLEAVFQRFNRATHGHSEAIPGAGIGLALVKELVEANNGNIALESQFGKGSTFTVTLPCQPIDDSTIETQDNSDTRSLINEQLDLEINSVDPSQTAEQQQTEPLKQETKPSNIHTPESNQQTILIVDDNADLRQLLSEQLGTKYQCLTAENGAQGVELAQSQLPDLVLSDIMMPVKDGYQLTEELKSDELTCHIPIILLTAKGSVESRLKGLQLLVDDYLAKPFNIEELMLRIHNILAIRDILKQRYRQVIDQLDPMAQIQLGDQIESSATEQSFIKKVNQLLTDNHHESEFNAKALSKALFISERQLQRKLKSQFDLSFPELLRNYRLNKALELLQSGRRVSQIYHEVGFASHSYFSSCFKAKFGKTPKAYQQDL